MAILLIGLSSCEKDDLAGKLNFPKISIIDEASNLKSSSFTKSSDVQALYFGELEIAAYHYRPGQAIQNRPGDGLYHTDGIQRDWSYFLFLPGGYNKSRNVLLTKSGEVKITDLLEVNYYDEPYLYLDKEYINKVNSFTMDVLEVVFNSTGIIKNNKLYGMFPLDNNLLSKYPEYSSIPYFNASTFWPGIDTLAAAISTMFVSDKFISTPLQVLVRDQRSDGTAIFNYVVEKSSRTLTLSESNFIKSLLDNGARRGFQYINFVPFSGDKSWVFTDDSFLHNIKVSIDLNNIYDDVKTNFDVIEERINSQMSWDTIFYKADARLIPFGLKVSF